MFALLQKTSNHPPCSKETGRISKADALQSYNVTCARWHNIYTIQSLREKSKGGRGGALHMRGFRKIENVMLSITIKEKG